jgi:hypothetical protein
MNTETQVSLTNDMVEQLFSKDSILQRSKEIQIASETTVDLKKEIVKLTNVSNPLHKAEASALEEIFMGNNPSDGVQGGSSLFKLMQGVSALGHRTEDESRKKDLEEISGKLMKRVK